MKDTIISVSFECPICGTVHYVHNIPMSYEYLIGLYKNYTNFQG